MKSKQYPYKVNDLRKKSTNSAIVVNQSQ